MSTLTTSPEMYPAPHSSPTQRQSTTASACSHLKAFEGQALFQLAAAQPNLKILLIQSLQRHTLELTKKVEGSLQKSLERSHVQTQNQNIKEKMDQGGRRDQNISKTKKGKKRGSEKDNLTIEFFYNKKKQDPKAQISNQKQEKSKEARIVSEKNQAGHSKDKDTSVTNTSINTLLTFKNNQTVNINQTKQLNDITTKEASQIFQQQSKNEEWLSQMNFEYFFKTLKDHPEDRNAPFIPLTPKQQLELESEEQEANEVPLFSKKKLPDKEWRTRSLKNTKQEENRRKSHRIEQMHQKQRLETQMKEMRYSFYRGKYRYQTPSVKFKLSFLDANCEEPEEYDCQTITDLPDLPLYQLIYTPQQAEFMIKLKRNSLVARMSNRQHYFN